MARPTLERYRADVIITVELGATDVEDAEERLDALIDVLRPRLEASVRNYRVGRPEALVVDRLGDASAV